MQLIVQKYGGSSLATPEHILRVARKIAEERQSGKSIVVVLSAMEGETDRLIELSSSFEKGVNSRSRDVIVSTGEQVSIGLMSLALESLGCPSETYLGWQVPLKTDEVYTKARILSVEKERIKSALDRGLVVIVAGFQGVSSRGHITTMGRGGSDTTAVAVAAATSADVCEIYTDVDGVYTTDPNICSQARHLKYITYEEMLEMSGLGAKVLQIRSVELARKYNVPLLVKSSFGGDRCTWIIKEGKKMEDAVISGVTLDKNEAKIFVMEVPDEPGVAFRIISPLAEASINVDMIIQNAGSNSTTDFTFTVPKSDLEQAGALVEKAAAEIGAGKVRTSRDIAKVSVVGIGVRNHPGVAAKVFRCLGEENINIQMISTSEIRISCVIDAKYGELAVRVLHEAFELHRDRESVN